MQAEQATPALTYVPPLTTFVPSLLTQSAVAYVPAAPVEELAAKIEQVSITQHQTADVQTAPLPVAASVPEVVAPVVPSPEVTQRTDTSALFSSVPVHSSPGLISFAAEEKSVPGSPSSFFEAQGQNAQPG